MPHSSDAVTDDAAYQDDTIFLNEQELVVRGPIRAGMIQEFSTGLKVGQATYDEREHAFWAVLDDFSGGFGHRTLNIREAGGTHFDNPGGVDLRRPRDITLPGQRTEVAADFNPSAIGEENSPFSSHAARFSDIGGLSLLHIGIGSAIYTFNTSGNLLRRHDGGASVERCMSILDFRPLSGTRRLYAMFGRDDEYHVSTDGTTWSTANTLVGQSGTVNILDAILWDSKIIAFVRQNASNEGIASSADGVNWDNDDASIGFHWKPLGDPAFLGVAMAPWGATAPYFIDPGDGRLFALDWYLFNAVPIEGLGDNHHLRRGTIWNGQVAVTDSRRVWLFSPASGGQIRDIGPFSDVNVPPSWADSDYRIVQLLPGGKDLFALCYAGDMAVIAANAWRLAVYNEAGWSWFGPEYSGVPWTGILGTLTTFSTGATRRRNIHVITHEDLSDLNVDIHSTRLSELGDTAYDEANEEFEDGPLSFETGWFDGGFVDLEGALYRLTFDGYSITSTETVQVEYRLNNDENASYIDLGTFTRNQQEVWFDEDHRGVAFKTVQFRITLDRGSDISKTPRLKALILLFDKRPHVRTSWTAQIDLSRTVARGIQIEGESATTEKIWHFLKGLVNTPQLIKLKVPSLESAGVNVRITDMPATITEFREGASGKGIIDLQMVETVAE